MTEQKKRLIEILFLLLITAVMYLPNVRGLTYFKDDWYYVYDGMIAGPDVFHEMFRIDRPARGYFFDAYFSLFGPQPLPYHISAFVWRGLSAIGGLWLFRLLWPKTRRLTFFAALLFAVFPGYYWWVSAIEYQPMIASLALQVLSLALTLQALPSGSSAFRILSAAGAVLTGWLSIAMVDYAIGMEFFRLICVFLLIRRNLPMSSLGMRLWKFLIAWSWNVIIPLGFLAWRIFLFRNERTATDIGLQLSGFFVDPLATGFRWFLQFFNSLLNLGVLAWVAQFPRFFFGMRLRESVYALFLAGIVVLLAFAAFRHLRRSSDHEAETAEANFAGREAFLAGLLGMMLGILPVIMANRTINLDGFSHYALPASLAAALFVAGFISTLSSRGMQQLFMVLLLVFAVLGHYSISETVLSEARAIEKFWWQFSWRVPALRSGTTLVIHYPSGNIGDDGNGVMEAANLIYFPDPSPAIPVQYKVSAVTLSDSNLKDVMAGKLTRQAVYRSHAVDYDYGNVLVVSQPTPASCVHVIDGGRPMISVYDPGNVILAAPSSNLANVLTEGEPSVPPAFAFGPEPDRTWCYFFEKADLALQRGDWEEVASLGEQAIELGYHPEDRSEWLPLLVGYALTGNEARVRQTGPKINAERSLRLQACEMLMKVEANLRPGIQELVDSVYCKSTE